MTPPFLRVVEYDLVAFRRAWLSIGPRIVLPFVFLGAIGLGLGRLIPGVEGLSYLEFLAPGLLVATAMQTGAQEGSWVPLGKIRSSRVYQAMLATPITIDDLLLGELAWVACRLLQSSLPFFVAMIVFGAVSSPEGVLALPVAVLAAIASYTPLMALTGIISRTDIFAVIFRVVITPLFLLAGVFFPVDRLPLGVQAVLWVTPIFHGVALARGLTSGHLQARPAAVDLLVLITITAAGFLAARITFHRRLLP